MGGTIYCPLLLFSILFLSSGPIGGPRTVRAANQTQIYSLMDYLFTDYKPEVRPTTNGEATYVYVAVFLLSVQNLNERSQELETAVIIEADWNDDYLSWNTADYGDLEFFTYPQEKIWLPDIIIENSVQSQEQLGYDENKVVINSDGTVVWKPSEVIKTGCDIDVTYYPFDTQTCNIIISTWMSNKDEIDIDPDKETNGMVLSRYSTSGTWELIGNKLELLPNDADITRFQYSIKLKRLRTYYILNIILPVLFLSFTASLVFYLPAEAGEKIGMSITVLLAYAVYLTIIANNMPQTSLQVSYLAVYLTLLLGLTAFGVVFSVFVLHVHHKPAESKIGPTTVKLTRCIRRALCINRKDAQENDHQDHQVSTSCIRRPRSKLHQVTSISPTPDDDATTPPPAYMKAEEEITWPKVAETIDRVLFISTSVLIVVITIVFLTILAVGASTGSDTDNSNSASATV